MRYEISIRRLKAQPVMSIRGRTTVENLPRTVGEFLREVGGYVRKQGGQAAGPLFTRYRPTSGPDLDLEAGIPVLAALPPSGRVRPGELPGGEVAVTVHVGPYEGLPAAGEALQTWARQNGREAAGPDWQSYVMDPATEPDPNRWRTEVLKPLKPQSG